MIEDCIYCKNGICKHPDWDGLECTFNGDEKYGFDCGIYDCGLYRWKNND